MSPTGFADVGDLGRVNTNEIIWSNRPGLGTFIVRFQLLVRRLTWWFTNPLFDQVTSFQRVAALQLAVARERIDSLQDASNLVSDRMLALERDVARLKREPRRDIGESGRDVVGVGSISAEKDGAAGTTAGSLPAGSPTALSLSEIEPLREQARALLRRVDELEAAARAADGQGGWAAP